MTDQYLSLSLMRSWAGAFFETKRNKKKFPILPNKLVTFHNQSYIDPNNC